MTVKEASEEPGAGVSQLIPPLLPRLWLCRRCSPGAGAASGTRWQQHTGDGPLPGQRLPPPPCSEGAGRSRDGSRAWWRRCHHLTASFPVPASPRQPQRGTDPSFISVRARGGATDRESPAALVPCPPCRPFIPSWQRRNSKPRLQAELHNHRNDRDRKHSFGKHFQSSL